MRKLYNYLRMSWATIRRLTDKASQHMGLPLVYGGVLLLAIFYFTNLTRYNWLTLLSVIAILLGIVGYVRGEKRKSLY
ncbi:hypothetical protein PRBRB14_09970 [Hallella multisaccharivorax DSM 17128]|uniref:Uncharacterized protein n=1 Tax=Hallella multisaccharivorax DSM 17128 TaxID=688246 RepID=F8N8L6_9BACT|nr:hypothetical protein [Hallella multisaccharivorax]EGN56583.1 hypothetical protein Premu_1148 [Hallella multisaccharivorax DSM 17128]GJG30118.1 hypothetical protein PRBRB14_09970 [Hallella multisaccharivorax DSM 17128]